MVEANYHQEGSKLFWPEPVFQKISGLCLQCVPLYDFLNSSFRPEHGYYPSSHSAACPQPQGPPELVQGPLAPLLGSWQVCRHSPTFPRVSSTLTPGKVGFPGLLLLWKGNLIPNWVALRPAVWMLRFGSIGPFSKSQVPWEVRINK